MPAALEIEVESGNSPLLVLRRRSGAWIEMLYDMCGVLLHTALLAVFETVFFWKVCYALTFSHNSFSLLFL